jgi:hypothetical protein
MKAMIENEAYQKMVYNVDLNSPLRLSQDKSFRVASSSLECNLKF